jgi:hypothetical protein
MRHVPLIPTPMMIITRRAMTNGLFGTSSFWKVIAFALIARRLLRKLMGSDPQTVAIERLEPGQTLILTGVRLRK